MLCNLKFVTIKTLVENFSSNNFILSGLARFGFIIEGDNKRKSLKFPNITQNINVLGFRSMEPSSRAGISNKNSVSQLIPFDRGRETTCVLAVRSSDMQCSHSSANNT